ncbi:unnamed protein product, partial [Prorocentrum cordatum]
MADMRMKAWSRQQQEVGMQPSWARVRGPTGALIMSMKRANWTCPAWHTMRIKEGYDLDYREICPIGVAAMLQRDVQAKPCEDWTQDERQSQAGTVCDISDRADEDEGKICECNIMPTDICLGCGLAVGTPHHRLYKCETLKEQRLQSQPEWQDVAEQQEGNLLWTRGLKSVGIGEDMYQCASMGPIVCDECLTIGDENLFTGDIVCDVPTLDCSEWAQTGWVAMSLTSEDQPKMQMLGPQPCTVPMHRKVKRAEMWAFLKVLQNALPPFDAHTDRRGIIEGLQKGEMWCTSWKRPHADLWKRIWHKVRDLDLDVSRVHRVTAHRAKSKIAQLQRTELKTAKGNEAQQAVEHLASKVRWAAMNIGWRYNNMPVEWPDVPERVPGARREKLVNQTVALTKHEEHGETRNVTTESSANVEWSVAEFDCGFGTQDIGFGASLQIDGQFGAKVSLDWVHGVGGYEQLSCAVEAHTGGLVAVRYARPPYTKSPEVFALWPAASEGGRDVRGISLGLFGFEPETLHPFPLVKVMCTAQALLAPDGEAGPDPLELHLYLRSRGT